MSRFLHLHLRIFIPYTEAENGDLIKKQNRGDYEKLYFFTDTINRLNYT